MFTYIKLSVSTFTHLCIPKTGAINLGLWNQIMKIYPKEN